MEPTSTEAQPQKIRLMIVDDHPLVRAGLQRTFEFEDDIELIGFCANGDEAIAQVERLKPDVMLLDINLPGMNGLQVARRLKTHNTRPAIIILTGHHDEEQVLHAMASGAAAYCPKEINPLTLVKIVRAVAAGYYVVSNRRMNIHEFATWMNQKIVESGKMHVDPEGHLVPLSPREMEILEYVTNGMINKEIANKLGISQQTVKNHMTSILKKLNVNDRTQAAIAALRRGWVRLENETDANEETH